MRIFRSHIRIRRVIATGGILAATAAATAGPAVAAPRSAPPGKVSWSVLPATASGPDRTRNLFSYGVVKPGSTIVDHVEIVNRGKRAAAFSLYATDAVGTTLQDALLLLPPGRKPADIGAWTTFPGGAAQLSTVIPGGKAIVERFSVTVPRLATPGDHTGGLVAAVGIPGKNGAGMAVVENYRIAVPIELRVPGALHGSVRVESLSAGFDDPLNPFGDGSAAISYTVDNTGNVRQTGTQAVTVTGPLGQKSTVRPPRLPTILPGDSVRVTVRLPGLYPAGPMTAHVTITPRWPARTIALAAATPPATGAASLFAAPWSLVGMILLLAAIGVAVWWTLRWRRREHRAEVAAAAAKARRDTERRLLGSKSSGQGGSPAP